MDPRWEGPPRREWQLLEEEVEHLERVVEEILEDNPLLTGPLPCPSPLPFRPDPTRYRFPEPQRTRRGLNVDSGNRGAPGEGCDSPLPYPPDPFRTTVEGVHLR